MSNRNAANQPWCRFTGFFYFAGIIGILIGWAVGHWLYDSIDRYYVHRHGVATPPEVRLWTCYLGAPIMFIALMLLGYGLDNKWHYMVIAVCYGLQDAGMLIVTVSVNAYLLQMYPEIPGEVSAWINLGRTAGGCTAVYAQIEWVARTGPKTTLATQGAIVVASLVIIVVLQLWGNRMARK